MPAIDRRERVVAAVGCAAIVAVCGLLLDRFYRDASFLKPHDFLQYWAAGRLNATGGNPYDADQVIELQRGAVRDEDRPTFMWNPPWVLALVMPFGLLPMRTGQLFWLLAQFAAVVWSADVIWRTYGGAAKYRPAVWAGALVFYPVMYLILLGQSGGWLLLGLAGFLVAARPLSPSPPPWGERAGVRGSGRQPLPQPLPEAERGARLSPPSLLGKGVGGLGSSQGPLTLTLSSQSGGEGTRRAGFALLTALAAVKPHLFLPFWLGLALNATQSKREAKLLFFGALAGVAAVLVAWAVNPDVWTQYFAALTRPETDAHRPLAGWQHPLIGYRLRLLTDPSAFWIQMLPAMLVAAAVPVYWWFRRATWDWRTELPRLLFAGLIAAPYGAWEHDQLVLLIPVLAGFARLMRDGTRFQLLLGAAAFAALNAVAMTLRESQEFVWLPPALLGWYVWVTAATRPVPVEVQRHALAGAAR